MQKCRKTYLRSSSSQQAEVSESVSQMSSSKTLWKSGAAPNHADLISMRLPSPPLSLARPAGCSRSLH